MALSPLNLLARLEREYQLAAVEHALQSMNSMDDCPPAPAGISTPRWRAMVRQCILGGDLVPVPIALRESTQPTNGTRWWTALRLW